LVKKEERLPVIGAVIDTNRFPPCARANGDVGIMFSVECSAFKVGFTVQVSPPISKGGQGGGFNEKFVRGPGVQGFVTDARRWRVGCGFRSRHGQESWERKTKVQQMGVWSEAKENSKKPYPREKLKKQGNEEMLRKNVNVRI